MDPRSPVPPAPGRGRSEAALLLVSALWGMTFPLIKGGLVDAGPMGFLALRSLLGFAILWPVLRCRIPSRAAWKPGILLGFALVLSYAAQTVGLDYTTPTRSAFITGLAVILTPVAYFLRTRRTPGPAPAVGALLAGGGLWLLTDPRGGGLNRGDLITLAAAAGYAVYIVELEILTLRRGYRDLLVVQSGVLAILFLPAALLEAEPIRWTGRLAASVGSTGGILALTFYLQNRFQRGTTAPRAGVIFATEPAFAAAFSWWMLGETLSGSQWTGAGFMLAGMIAAVIPPPRGRRGVDPSPPGG